MDLLKMLVVPLVLVSIIRVIMNMNQDDNLSKLTTRTVLMLLGTTAIAATIGLIVGNIFNLGVGTEVIQTSESLREITPVVDTLRGLLPSNPVAAMANGNIVAIVIFAAFIGLAIKRLSTLPVTIEALTDNVGVEAGTSSFVGTLGSNMGMNGCAGIYPALMIVTISNMAGVEMNFSLYAMSLIVITIGSLGIAGLPGTATMAVSVVLSGVGLGSYFPLAGGILAIDPILDMERTMLNVNGTMTCAVTVANSLGKINK